MDKYLGLYVHIPFCLQKCKYCDFVSFSNQEKYHEKYVKALLSEAEKYKGMTFETAFIGGGTPTILSPKLLDMLIGGLHDNFNFTQSLEFSVEANPKTIDNEKLGILKSGGVNRISIGVQSFNDNELKALGRIHMSGDAYNTVSLAKKYFDNVNVDIMTSIPHQTVKSLTDTINTALKLDVSHISCYSLIVENGTEFEKLYSNCTYSYPSEDEDRQLFQTAYDILTNSGYNRYEISNFAKGGAECRHNLKYWTTNEYLGLGIAAHSYIGGVRYSNTTNLIKYMNSDNYTENKIILDEDDKISEYIMMSLRTAAGLDGMEFYKRFNKDFFETHKDKIEKYINGGFMIKKGNNVAFTDKGFDVSNTILSEFI